MAFADYDKILLFGDSITEQAYEQTRGFGFAAELANGVNVSQVYRRKLEVVGRGFSGYNTLHALDILPKIIPQPNSISRIILTVVFLGANDAVLLGQPQHVPLDQYFNNLRRIINHSALQAHGTKFILVGPAPICEYDTQEHDAGNGIDYIQRLAATTKQYADAALVIGKELGVPTINLWEAFMEYVGGWEDGKPLPGSKEAPKNPKFAELFRDGLHFLPKGFVKPDLIKFYKYEILYGLVRSTIKESYPDLDPEGLEFVFPRWEVAPKAAAW